MASNENMTSTTIGKSTSTPMLCYPSLRSNLIALYKHQQGTRINNNNNNNNNNTSSSNSSNSSTHGTHFNGGPGREKFVLRNPQSLLSHEPSHLSRTIDSTLREVNQLRNEVSNTIVSDCIVGNSIPSFLVTVNANVNINANINANMNHDEGGDEDNASNYNFKFNSNPLIRTSVSLRNLCQISTSTSTLSSHCPPSIFSSSPLSYLKTGSQELDQLLSSSSSSLQSQYSSVSPPLTSASTSTSASASTNRGHKRKRLHEYQQRHNFEYNNNRAQIGLGLEKGVGLTTTGGRKYEYEYDSNHYHDNRHISTCGGGGVQIGTITEICGVSSSGKTQLALSLAVNAILQLPSRNSQGQGTDDDNVNNNDNISTRHRQNQFMVHYLTGGGGGSALMSLARRFRELCRHRLELIKSMSKATSSDGNRNGSVNTHGHGHGDDHDHDHDHGHHNDDEHSDVLEKINFIPVGDNAYYLLAELNQLEKKLKSDIPNTVNRDRGRDQNTLIVIDSISGCLSSYLYADGDGGAGSALMNEISLALRRLSQLVVVVEGSDSDGRSGNENGHCVTITRKCAVLITNGMVADGSFSYNKNSYGNSSGGGSSTTRGYGYGYKPALGESWRAADVRLIIEPIHHTFDDDEHDTDINTDKTSKGRKAVSGLKVSKLAVVGARLVKHYAKRCGNDGMNHTQFGINSTGVVDVKDSRHVKC